MKIKTSYDELTVGEYTEIISIINESKNDVIDKEVNLAAVLTGETVDTILQLPIFQFKQIIQKTDWLLKAPTPNRVKQVTLDNIEFKVNYNITSFNSGRFIDLLEITKGDALENLSMTLAILLEPKSQKFKYNDFPIQDIAKLIDKELPITQAVGIMDFFYPLFHSFSEITKTFLEAKLVMEKPTPLEKDGDGLELLKK